MSNMHLFQNQPASMVDRIGTTRIHVAVPQADNCCQYLLYVIQIYGDLLIYFDISYKSLFIFCYFFKNGAGTFIQISFNSNWFFSKAKPGDSFISANPLLLDIVKMEAIFSFS